jgi:hypothetical protein
MRSVLSVTTILAVVIRDGKGYSLNVPSSKATVGNMSAPPVSRQNFIATLAGAVTVGMVSADVTWAKDSDSTKGTKEDPTYQACLSQCELQILGP